MTVEKRSLEPHQDDITDRRLVIFVLVLSLVASLLVYAADFSNTFMPFLVLAMLGALLMAWFGRVKAAGWFAPWAAIALLGVFLFRELGVRNIAMLGFPVTIVAGSLMNGRRGAIVFGFASIAILVGLGIAESTGVVVNESIIRNSLADYIVVIVLIILTVAMQWAVISRLNEKNRSIWNALNEHMGTEAALRESEERYRTVVETFPDIIMIVNLEGKILFANAALETQLGLTAEDVQNAPMGLFHPEDVGRVQTAIEDLLSSEQTATDLIENRFVDKQGGVHWYSGVMSKVQYQGELCLHTVAREITAQKMAELAMKESEKRYRLISSATSDYTFSTEVNAEGEMALNWVAGAFEAITGYTLEEYKAAGGWAALLHPDDREMDMQALESLKKNKTIVHEIRTMTRKKETQWVRVYAHPVWDEENQRLAGIVGAVQDVTGRKLAEGQTNQANQMLQRRIQEISALNLAAQAGADTLNENEMLEAVVDILYQTLYPDGVNIALMNPFSGKLETHPIANRGIPPDILFDPYRRPLQSAFGQVVASGRPYRMTDTTLPDILQRIPGIHSEICVPILAGERLLGVLDVTSKKRDAFGDADEHLLVTVAGQLATAIDRLRAEQQLRKLNIDLEQRVNERTALLEMANRELEAFSYSVSHDLRAPLRRINGFARILVEDFSEEITPEMAKYIEKISNSSAKMAQLIDGLLDFSRLGRKSLSRTTMELNGLVRTLIETLSAEASDCEIDWVTADLPPVYADPVLMQQVFANLLGNAVKYTSKCQAARIEIGKLAQDGKTVFFVRDNGVGFDMTYAEHLFGVFQRFHNDDEFEGAGIGLALVKRIIERHGGQIWAEAEPDKGATFYFSLG